MKSTSRMEQFKNSYETMLRKCIRQAQSVSIDVVRKNKKVTSKVSVSTKGRVFWASKSAATLNEALRKSAYAVLRQVKKSYGRQFSKPHDVGFADTYHMK